MVEKYKILEVGNIYFPLKDMGKEFEIIETRDFIIDTEKSKKLNKLKGLAFKDIYLNYIIKEIWEEIKKDKDLIKRYKKGWLVPVGINFGESISCTVDILMPLKKQKHL